MRHSINIKQVARLKKYVSSGNTLIDAQGYLSDKLFKFLRQIHMCQGTATSWCVTLDIQISNLIFTKDTLA